MYAISLDGQFTNLVISVTQFWLLTILVLCEIWAVFLFRFWVIWWITCRETWSKRFHFKELQFATHIFSSKHILGSRGFGNVYKGFLQDDTLLAVKRLKDVNATEGEAQFQTKVEMIWFPAHSHLSRLFRICMAST